ncbi:MAG TPA: hypothetical protein PK243_10560 [Flexilinea sp.]|nr:hypothetical protein [Flexilinea sp.]
MATFKEAQERAEALTPEKISNDFFQFVRSLEPYLAQLNKAAIFIDSEDIFGDPIGFYSRATEVISQGRKREGQPFNLFETGDFLDGFFAEVKDETITFGTTDSKKEKVEENTLSNDLYGLRDEDLKKVIDEKLSPFFSEYFKREL